MDPRPRVSRETRLLFATIIGAILALWVLARFRFPERPAPANPIVPVLTQLAPTPGFSDLAAAIADVRPRALLPFVTVPLHAETVIRAGARPEAIAGFRVRDDVAIALPARPAGSGGAAPAVDAPVIAHDPATGLTALKVPSAGRPALTYWSPTQLDNPRYFLVTTATPDGLSLRPVFVSSLTAATSALWNAEVWLLPQNQAVAPGTFLFTTTGTIVGLAVTHEERLAVLPMDALIGVAEQILQRPSVPQGWLGLDVQPLTPALASATGAGGGLIVTYVDRDGPASGSIQIADVLESLDGSAGTLTRDRWTARIARLAPGESVTVHVRRGAMTQPVRLTATERGARPPALGLVLRRVATGAEVLRVEPGSAAHGAGIRAGDIVTFAGGVTTPTPAQVGSAFANAAGRPILFGLTRGDEHLVVPVSPR